MDTALGLLELTFYVCAILALSAAVTYAVVRISPAQSAKQTADKTEPDPRSGARRPWRRGRPAG